MNYNQCNFVRWALAGAYLAAFSFAALVEPVLSQSPPPASPDASVVTATGSFSGKWTYRSYVNDPNIPADVGFRIFGRAEIEIAENADGTVTGKIGGPSWSLILAGAAKYDSSGAVIKVQGSGNVSQPNGTVEFWVYDYFGYLAPNWSIGVEQRPTILGTVVRTVPHGGNPAGFVGSFLAVKQ